MTSPRKNKHRPERELNKVQELRELRQENKQLRKQVSRLRRELEKYEGEVPEETDTQVDTLDLLIEKANTEPDRCPICNSGEIGSYKTPSGKTLLGCRSCKKFQRSIPAN